MVTVERIKQTATLSFFLIGFLSVFRTIFMLWNSFLPDYSTRYDSSALLLRGINPYLNLSSFTPENYLPVALLFLTPITFLSFELSSKIWLLLSLFMINLCIIVLSKILHLSLFQTSILFFLCFISFPFKFTMGMGQVNIVILFFLIIFYYATIKNKQLLAGTSLALASSVKLFPSVFLLLILLRRKYKMLFYGISIITFLFLFSYMVLGKDINIYYYKNIFFPLVFGNGGIDYYNQSITGLFSRLNVSIVVLILLRAAIVLATITFVVKKGNSDYDVPLFTVMMLLVNNFTWQHHLILLLLPFAILLKKSSVITQIFMLIAYFLIALNIKNPALLVQNWYGPIVLSHGFFGMIILWVLLFFKKGKARYIIR